MSQKTDTKMAEGFSKALRFISDSEVGKLQDLFSQGSDPNYADPRHGNTSLRAIAQSGNCEILKTYIEAGADVNQRINYKSPVDGREEFGYTPIFYSSDLSILRALISFGADVNAQAVDGETPLMRFCRFSFSEIPAIIDIFLSAGADANLTDDHGSTALDIAKNTNRTLVKIKKKRSDSNSQTELETSNSIVKLLQEYEI